MVDPWAFGWNQLLTIAGLIITASIAVGGFRTFDRWKREKIEERRIDIALDSLSIAHESKTVFGRIRNPNGFEGEWARMPIKEDESEEHRTRRGGSYATLVRLGKEAEYFDRVSRLRPKAVAIFGAPAEAAFERLETARFWVEDAAIQLTWQLPLEPKERSQKDFDMRMRLRGDLWAGFGKQGDRVEKELVGFRNEIEAIFKPIIAKWVGHH
jgi:hypothetical protein